MKSFGYVQIFCIFTVQNIKVMLSQEQELILSEYSGLYDIAYLSSSSPNEGRVRVE